MEEKVLIESKRGNIKLISGIIIGIGIVAFLILYGALLKNISNDFVHSGSPSRLAFARAIRCNRGKEVLYLSLASTILPCLIASIIFYLSQIKTFIAVTNRKIYGCTVFGKRVDLPMDMVSSVGTSWAKGISVGTSSGRITFNFIENQQEIHKILNDLIIERQKKASVQNVTAASDADELQKYKNLLDNGVITQEEFDAKKKQLLGL